MTRSVAVFVLGMVLTLAAAPGSLSAQPSFNVSLGRAFNAFSESSAPESRQSTAASVDLEHHAADGRLRLYYVLDAGSYTTPGDWAYQLHGAGATWKFGEKPEDGKRVPAVYVGGLVSWRANGTSWSAADYRGVALFANLERHPGATSTFRAGYRFDLRDFPDSSGLDQQQHDGFASFLVNFQTRTTLIAEAHVGAKKYPGGLTTIQSPLWADYQLYPSSATAHGGKGPGAGVGLGQSLRWTMPAAELTPGALSGQASMLVRLAQSLADRTAASIQVTHRSTFGDLPTVIITTPALFFDDGVYDDPFASEANTVTGSLKHVRPGGLELEAQGVWMRKDYRAATALGLDGVALASGELRGDRIWRAGAGASVPLFSNRSGPLALSLDLGYWFTRHSSNDAFYNYRSHSLGLGFSIAY